MRRVLFAVPYAMESTLRFLRGAVGVEGARVAVLSQEGPERLPRDLRARLADFERVPDMLDADQLERGVRAVGSRLGGADRLIGILEQLQEPMAEVRERLGIEGMSREAAAKFRDKARMKEVLRAQGLPCARHGLAESAEAALAAAEHTGYPLVVKPPAGAGAKQTFRVSEEEELRGYLRAFPPRPGQPVLLEEYVIGKEHSFDTVTVGGEHRFHSISHYHPTPLEVMESPWIQWCVHLPRSIEDDAYEDIRAAAFRALTALGMVTGLSHLEWFRRPDGSLAISEVAARPPGAQFTSLLSYAHDHDFYRAWAELLVHDRFQVPERRYSCGAVYLRGQGEGRVKGLEGLAEAQRALGDLVVEAKLPRSGQPKATSYEGEGYVILRHPDTEVVERGLKQLLGLVKIELG